MTSYENLIMSILKGDTPKEKHDYLCSIVDGRNAIDFATWIRENAKPATDGKHWVFNGVNFYKESDLWNEWHSKICKYCGVKTWFGEDICYMNHEQLKGDDYKQSNT